MLCFNSKIKTIKMLHLEDARQGKKYRYIKKNERHKRYKNPMSYIFSNKLKCTFICIAKISFENNIKKTQVI